MLTWCTVGWGYGLTGSGSGAPALPTEMAAPDVWARVPSGGCHCGVGQPVPSAASLVSTR